MVRIALLFVIFVGFTGITNSQTYNPTDGNVIVSFDLPEKGIYSISVYGNLGNEIFKQEINSGANLNVEFELKSNSFAIGTYNVVISGSNGEIMNGKFIKVK
ncbi:MAG: T9SS type A sorting domain-containing protein [Desulfobulbaceae bacterium]|nr:T9SS type A sorting domain-containing protein [Desulfobulbaceae bacterium]MBS4001314.1 T9SS type A sorting domain-containing protein [Desulfobulbaceae bacterium]